VPVPEIVPVTISVWLALNVVVLGEGASGAVSSECTVTGEEADDVCVSGVEALSVISSSNA
jgi:hypothetical protein